MRPMTDAALAALTGSRSGDGVRVHVWLDGRTVAENLPVSDWSLTWNLARQVQGQWSCTVTDVDGTLAPWAIDDPLGVGGPRMQVIYGIGGTNETVDIGWYRTVQSDPAESWRVYTLPSAQPDARFGERVVWVSGGASIPVQGDDLTRVVVDDRLLAPSSPAAGATVLSEVRRLMTGIMPVTVTDGVVDAAVPSSVVFERERMDAIEDLLARIDAAARMTGDGQLEVYPTAKTDPVWSVVGGDGGALVSVQRSQSAEGLYNAVVSEGTDSTTKLTVRGTALEDTGPLRWQGPMWRVPMFRSSPLIETQAAATADARTTLAGRVSSRQVTLNVTCLPHPGLQVGDWVQVACPLVDDEPYPLVGQVTSMTLRGSAEGVSPMTMKVACAFEDVQAVARAARRG